MEYKTRHNYSESLLKSLEEKQNQCFHHYQGSRRVHYKAIVKDNGLELRRATSKGTYPDKDGYVWFIDGELNLETVDRLLDVVCDDFQNKRNNNRTRTALEVFKKRYYSIIYDYGVEYADCLLEDPESFVENVCRNDEWSSNKTYWNDVKYKDDVSEWIYWSIDPESIYEYVEECMVCDDDAKRCDDEYSREEYEYFVEKAGGKELNYFSGGISKRIKSCVGFKWGYACFALRFNNRFYKEFSTYDVYDGEADEDNYRSSNISIGETPDSIKHNVSIREGDLSFMEDIDGRLHHDGWCWDKVYADAKKKISKELGKNAVYFAFPDACTCVAEYVVGNRTFAKWFKKKYPGVDLKAWLIENIVDEDGEYFDHSYEQSFSFEEWWKESFED